MQGTARASSDPAVNFQNGDPWTKMQSCCYFLAICSVSLCVNVSGSSWSLWNFCAVSGQWLYACLHPCIPHSFSLFLIWMPKRSIKWDCKCITHCKLLGQQPCAGQLVCSLCTHNKPSVFMLLDWEQYPGECMWHDLYSCMASQLVYIWLEDAV